VLIQVHRLNVFRPSFAIQGCSTLVRKSETKVSIESSVPVRYVPLYDGTGLLRPSVRHNIRRTCSIDGTYLTGTLDSMATFVSLLRTRVLHPCIAKDGRNTFSRCPCTPRHVLHA